MGQEQHDRQTAWGQAHNLRPSPSAACCPRNVAGRRCTAFGSTNRWLHGQMTTCECQHLAFRAVQDHERMWLHGKTHILTSEVYAVTDQELAACKELLEPLKVAVHVVPGGVWTDGTVILVCTRQGFDMAELNM